MFHRMAQLVASLPLISFDISRSQSRLRIATTAAPISAADLEREWMDSMSDATLHPGSRTSGSHHGEGSMSRHHWRNNSLHRLSDALHALFQHRQPGQSHHGRASATHSHHGGTSFYWGPSPSQSVHSTHGKGAYSKPSPSPLPHRPGSSHGGKHLESEDSSKESLV